MEWLLSVISIGILSLVFYIVSLVKTGERLRSRERELEEWSGITNVKKEIDNELADPDKRKRVRDRYNSTP